ncbi:hypothetical protein PMZ80_008035 [Knufia obscura]|uniref:C2H2-type domain-containing protein n=1 Tax=Knufia obscura TaxID=1635080 RepID=A0ABR0RGC0_9EURO|nr:hypothetical protein PMZ80_008035 [Knufia obscura]
MPFRDIFSELEDFVLDRGTHAVWQGPNFNVMVSKRVVKKVLSNLSSNSESRELFKAHYAKFFDPSAHHAESLDKDLHERVLLELLDARDINAESAFHLLIDEVGVDIGIHVYGLFRGYRDLELRLAEKPAEEGTATQTPLIDAVRLIHQIGDPPVCTQAPAEPVERRFRCMLRDCAKPITSVSIHQLRNHLNKHHQYSWDAINSISKDNNNEGLWKRFGPFSKQELEDSGYEMRNFKSRQSGFPTKAQDPQQEETGEDETSHPTEADQAESLQTAAKEQNTTEKQATDRKKPKASTKDHAEDEARHIEVDGSEGEPRGTPLQNEPGSTGDLDEGGVTQDRAKAQSKSRSKSRTNAKRKKDQSRAAYKQHDQEDRTTSSRRSVS